MSPRPLRLLTLALCALAFSACTSTTQFGLSEPLGPAPAQAQLTSTGLFDEDIDEGRDEWIPAPTRVPDVQPRRTEPESSCEIEYLGEDLTSNRHNGLPARHLQVVLFYDGVPSSSPELRVQLDDGSELRIGGASAGGTIETFGRTIETREYVRGHSGDSELVLAAWTQKVP